RTRILTSRRNNRAVTSGAPWDAPLRGSRSRIKVPEHFAPGPGRDLGHPLVGRVAEEAHRAVREAEVAAAGVHAVPVDLVAINVDVARLVVDKRLRTRFPNLRSGARLHQGAVGVIALAGAQDDVPGAQVVEPRPGVP